MTLLAHDSKHIASLPAFLQGSLRQNLQEAPIFDQVIWVVPTNRLAAIYEYELSRTYQALVPPKILTWSQFLQVSCERLKVETHQGLHPASGPKCAWELRKLLNTPGSFWESVGIGLGFEQEIQGLWRDLLLAMGGSDALLHLEAKLAEFPMFHEEAQTTTAKRIQAIFQLLTETEVTLSKQGWVSEYQVQRACSQAISMELQKTNQVEFLENETLYFYGLRSLPAIGHGLLQVLSERANVYIDESCKKPSEASTPNLFTRKAVETLSYQQASDPLQECEAAIYACCQILTENPNVTPKDLCIAVMDEKKFGDPLLELAEKHFKSRQIPYNHAIGSLKALSPCFRYFESLKSQESELTWAEAIDKTPEGIDATPLLEGLLELDPALLDQPLKSSLQSVLQILGETQEHPSGQALRGVQVLRFSETRFLKFHKVFVLGADAKSLPSLSKPLSLLGHGLRRWIDLPSPEEKLRLEICNLADLLENCQEISFSYSKRSGNMERFPSRLLEQIAGKVRPITHELGLKIHSAKLTGSLQAWDAPKAPEIEQIKSTLTPSKADQLLRCPGRYFLLQNKVKPWEGHTNHLDARDEGKFIHRVLEVALNQSHKKLSGVWSSWLKQESDKTKEALLHALRDVCVRVLAEESKTNPSGLSDVFLLQFKHHSIPRWAEFMVELACLSRSPGFWNELQTETQWTAKVGGFEFKGVSDLKVKVGAVPVVVDYKRTSRTPVRKVTEGLAVQLPLYGLAEMMQNQRNGVNDGENHDTENQVLLGYWDVLAGEWRPMNALPKKDPSELAASALHKPRGKKQLSELIEAAEQQLNLVTEQIKQKGSFFLRTDDCDYCEFKPVCRVTQIEPNAENSLHLEGSV